jgi:tRNA dimethylallyltransferase
VDPESAAVIHKNNVRRVLRALEIYETTGKKKSEWDKESREGEGAVCLLHITLDFKNRDVLYERIDRRVHLMMEQGLLSEVEALYKRGLLSTNTAAMGAIGYKEFLPYFRGECTLEDVEAAICLGTRHYAKRQQTWFRRLSDVKTIYMDTDDGQMRPADEIYSEAMEYLLPFMRAHYPCD